MTSVVAVTSDETIWVLADRRISFETGRRINNGRKVMFLDAPDGTAILAYAGLGVTAKGTEISDWMSAVLCGRRLPMEQCIVALAEALLRQFPPHMLDLPGSALRAHSVQIPAFVGGEPRLYTIDLIVAPDGRVVRFRHTRWGTPYAAGVVRAPRIGIAGTGAFYLIKQDKVWRRDLLRMVKACNRGRISPLSVADHLARLNNTVHGGVSDQSVGPECIVAWRFRKGDPRNGGQQLYSETGRTCSVMLPTVSGGTDIEAILRALTPHSLHYHRAARAGVPMGERAVGAPVIDLSRVRTEPDENLL